MTKKAIPGQDGPVLTQEDELDAEKFRRAVVEESIDDLRRKHGEQILKMEHVFEKELEEAKAEAFAEGKQAGAAENDLRDRIAFRVMEILLQKENWGPHNAENAVAKTAYDVADGMMARRAARVATEPAPPHSRACTMPVIDALQEEAIELHGPDACLFNCPACDEGEHHWKTAQSYPRKEGDTTPEHPAEKQNLGIWLQCVHCDAWAERLG